MDGTKKLGGGIKGFCCARRSMSIDTDNGMHGFGSLQGGRVAFSRVFALLLGHIHGWNMGQADHRCFPPDHQCLFPR